MKAKSIYREDESSYLLNMNKKESEIVPTPCIILPGCLRVWIKVLIRTGRTEEILF